MKKTRVLVTGAGSGVGQGIVKALRASCLPITIVSADISPLKAALYVSDEAVLIPEVEKEGALEATIALLRKHDIHVVMIGSEFDLEFFARHRDIVERETGALIVTSPLETVLIADDKWRTAEFLRENGLPYAESYLPAGVDDAVEKARLWGYPIVLKTRKGTSNRHVHLIYDDAFLLNLFQTVPMPMLQRVIDVPIASLKAEYTCSIFKCRDGTLLGPFTARRTLRGGNSWIVEVDEFAELNSMLLSVGRLMCIMGSLNIQLMLGTDGSPVPFEFNARFSGTTAVRAHFGFNEPEMVLRNYLYGDTLETPVIRRGVALRYLEEVFIEGKCVDELKNTFPKGIVRKWF